MKVPPPKPTRRRRQVHRHGGDAIEAVEAVCGPGTGDDVRTLVEQGLGDASPMPSPARYDGDSVGELEVHDCSSWIRLMLLAGDTGSWRRCSADPAGCI
jgi:hypothetical protein